MDLAGLRSAVRLRANVPSTDLVWTDDFVDSAINTAIAQISLEQPWWWLQVKVTTTATDGLVDLSDNTEFPKDVRDISHVFVGTHEAKKVSAAETDLLADVGPEDTRYIFSVWGDSLQIVSSPSATDTVTVRYYQDEPLLSGDSDTPLMPAVYHPSIVEKACAIGFESLDDQTSAAMHEARSRSLVAHMIATALRRIRGRHSVRVRSGYPI